MNMHRLKATLYIVIGILLVSEPVLAQSWKILADRADSLNRAGQVNGAYAAYEQAERRAEIEFGRDHFNTVQTQLMLGAVLIQKGEYKPAEKKLIAAYHLLSRIAPDSTERVEAINYLGIIYRNQANYGKADSVMQKALAATSVLPAAARRKYRAYALGNLASLYRVMHNARRAEPLLIEALAIQDSLTGKLNPEYASYLSSLASVYNSLQQYVRAEPLYLEALAITSQLFSDEHPRVALVLNNLATLYFDLGNYTKALSYSLKALNIREKTGSRGRDYLLNLQNLAVFYDKTKQFRLADSLYNRVLTMIEQQLGKSNITYANTLMNRASLFRESGRYADVCKVSEEALSLAKSAIGTENDLYARMLNSTAVSYQYVGNYVKADSLNTAALAICERVLGKNTVAYAVYLFTQGQLSWQSGRRQEGIVVMNEALSRMTGNFNRNFLTMTASQKDAFLSQWQGLYRQYFSIITARGSVLTSSAPQAYDVTISLKNMLLNEHSQVITTLNQSDDILLKNRLDSLYKAKNLLADLYIKPAKDRQNIDSLEAQAEVLEKALAHQSTAFRQAQQSLQIRWEDIRNTLKSDEAAVECISFPYYNGIFPTDSIRYMALIVRSTDKVPQIVPLLADERPLRQLLARKAGTADPAALYAARGSEIDTDQLTRGDSLYRLIWEPIDRLLTGIKTVYLSPSGLLHQVSFGALPYPGSTKKGIRYLADRYELRQIGNTRQVVAQAGNDNRYNDLVSVQLYGGIQYDTAAASLSVRTTTYVAREPNELAWAYLPGSQQEVTQIGQLIGSKATVITGSAATETALKNVSGRSPTVLHIATHGFAFPDPAVTPNDSGANRGEAMFRRIANPLLRTGLLMAGANRAWLGGRPALGEDDGILTAYEVASLNLSGTRLVILSACETALGDIRGSEGVFGLQRAFKMAGAGQLLISLWPVSDRATSTMMRTFYQQWKKHKTSRIAFQKTQSLMRKKYSPSVWAAFVLIE
ncbi:CHAT domain-containing tetratricopeptide repeat protein [Spirosoma koreense]